MIIYEIKNKLNNHSYIGYSTKFNSNEELQQSNYWGSGIAINNAIQKYGKRNFERKILLKDIFDFKKLNQYEILWIKKKNTKKPNGYNLTDGGGGIIDSSGEIGRRLSKDRIKRGLSKGKNNPMWGKFGEKHHMFGKKNPIVSKIMKLRTGENNSNFGNHKLAGQNNPNFGKGFYSIWVEKYGKETADEKMNIFKEKMSKLQKGKKNPEHSKRMMGENNPNFGNKARNKGDKDARKLR
jgi:hypothetical protein